MSMGKFLADFQIDLAALSRIKKRVFIVGRFNQAGKGKDPEIFLFTNRGDLSPKYLQNFNSRYDMRYESFVQALRPAIAERYDKDGRFPTVEQVIPEGEEAHEGTSVIDGYNWFFQRAVSNTDQQAFQNIRPHLRKELLTGNDKDRGKTILTQIRQNLQTFCDFQPQTHGVVDAMVILLGRCGREHGLPAFAAGAALPGGFPERLIDFVYQENDRAPFQLKGLDFSGGPWAKLDRDEKARQMFCNVVSSFRDVLLGSSADQYDDIRFRGQPLGKIARQVVPEDLQKKFQKSRDAFNGLRQILRSKVLLSMVLEWLLSAYNEVPDAAKIPFGEEHAYERDQAVETAILERWKQNKLAPPVKRPSPEERVDFSKALTSNFEQLLSVVLAKATDYEEKLAKLPGQLQDLAKEIRADEQKTRLLATVSGADLGEDIRKGFIDAAKTMLLDVMCPVLYRSPIVSETQLKRFFRQETMAAYLTAVFLSGKNQDAVRRIAEDHLEFFEGKIDEQTKKIRDVDEVMKKLLDDFVDVLATPEIQKRLTEGIRVLTEVNAMLEAGEMDKERGAGSISAIRPSAEVQKKMDTLQNTPASEEVIQIAVPAKVREALEAKLDAYARAAGEEGSPSVQTSWSAHETSDAESAALTAEAEAEKMRSTTKLDTKIDEILGKVLPSAPKEALSDEDKTALVEQASEQVLADTKFVGGLTADLQAFEKTLHLIYTRYGENADKRTFRNKVERMTLINMMLLFKKDLGLGQVCSNLYQLLIDMVLHLDPQNPDPKEFLREKSLTLYFDNADVENGGITELRQTLEVQGVRSLQNIVNFVSELRGIKYLMDMVAPDPDAEVVVVNGTADEFINWLARDNLTPGEGIGRLRSGMIVKTNQASDSAIPPGMAYLTDIAFPSGGKKAWIEKLASGSFSMQNQGLSLLLPPLCISTPTQDKNDLWFREGESAAAAASAAPAPIVVVGPSPFLNPPGDGFPTVLPAGYLFCAHLLSSPAQHVTNRNVAQQSRGRFRIVGYGAAPMRDSLNRILWGEGEKDSYAFAVDFYLYIVLTVLATAARYGGTQKPNLKSFFPCFHDSEMVLNKSNYNSSKDLNIGFIGGDALRFAMNQDVSAPADLESVTVAIDPQRNLLRKDADRIVITDVAWFNVARKMAGLT
jgi:hypothetical protein